MRALAIVLLLGATAAAREQAPSPAPADLPGADDEPIRHELDELRARQRELERRLDAAEARARVSTPITPPFRLGRDGVVFSTADGKTEIRFRGTLHVDARLYFGGDQPIPDTFLIRRARPYIEGTLFGVIDFRLMPNFAQGQAVLDDAYIDLHPWPWLRLRAGKWRSPIGLEWLQSDSTIVLVERSLASDLVPFRDLGVTLAGDIAGGTFSYVLGVFNGAPDSANGPDFDPQSEKDYVGRIFFRPLVRTRAASWANLGFGVAASFGQLKATSAASGLPIYHSTGQQPIFTYLEDPADPVQPDRRWRASPQLYFYLGPVGLLAEYVLSSQRVERLGVVADLTHQAWNLTASFVMTLERASYEGVVPRHPIDFRTRSFGAFELAFRYSELRLDPSAFPVFADPTTSVRTARELAAGLNWYMTDNVRIMLSFNHTDFVGGGLLGDRAPENALLVRLQLSL